MIATFVTKARNWLMAALVAISPLFALQGGPVQPDYMQFEPSGMKDMVSLQTGNFAYSIPLGELPGPYGGYPQVYLTTLEFLPNKRLHGLDSVGPFLRGA